MGGTNESVRQKVQPDAQFGRWTVLRACTEEKDGEKKWLCRCACGTERNVLERSLYYGTSLSCGCLKLDRAREVTSKDLSGKVFEDLTVLESIPAKDKRRGVWWRCRCSCGNIVELPGTLLITGRRSHCGRKSENHYAYADIKGQCFNRLTALYPLNIRDKKGNVMWHCRCECGNEIDVSYNNLVYSNMKSCGCQKRENDQIVVEI